VRGHNRRMFPMNPKPQESEPNDLPETGGQEGSERSIAHDEAMKRIIKQHPQRDIPRVESIEPREAPPKE
jgi:hypothetical protein